MNRLAVPLGACAVVLGAAFVLYKLVFAASGAYEVYAQFADALAFDRWDEARALAGSEEAREFVEEKASLRESMGYTAYRMMIGVVHLGPFRSVDSESFDGERATLRVTQEERRGPPTFAAVGPNNTRRKHEAVLVSTPEGWKIEAFTETNEYFNDSPMVGELVEE
jgi:hypothetical protein